MFEKILYSLNQNSNLMLVFIIVIAVFWLITLFFTTRISKKSTLLYGLLLGINNIDIIEISAIFIKVFLVFYSIVVYSEKIIFNIIMLGIISIIYLIFSFDIKRMVFEIINFIAQAISIFLMNSLSGYAIEVGRADFSVFAIRILLAFFIGIYTLYFTLRALQDIVIKNNNIRRRKNYEIKSEKAKVEEG